MECSGDGSCARVTVFPRRVATDKKQIQCCCGEKGGILWKQKEIHVDCLNINIRGQRRQKECVVHQCFLFQNLAKCLSVTHMELRYPYITLFLTHKSILKYFPPLGFFFSWCYAVNIVSSNFIFLCLGMISYRSMPVWLNAWKWVEVFKIKKKKNKTKKKKPLTFDVHIPPETCRSIAQVGWFTRHFEA